MSDSKHHQHLQYSLNRGRKRSRPPKLADSSAQTAETEEFPRLTCTERKVRPSASFDYYSRVKKSLQEIPAEVLTRYGIDLNVTFFARKMNSKCMVLHFSQVPQGQEGER